MEPVHALLHTLCKSHGQSITACAADAKRADEAERSIREHAECFSAEEHRFAIDARAKMPCGHFEVYAVSPDGKSVFCSLCQLAAANAEIERLKGLIDTWAQSSSEWPTLATLEALANAARHLLAVHDCDAHGHETVRLSEIRAREIIAAITENRERS